MWFEWFMFGSVQSVIYSRINCRVVAMDLRAHGTYSLRITVLYQTFEVETREHTPTHQVVLSFCAFLTCRWHQSKKPWWSLSGHNGQVSSQMEGLRKMLESFTHADTHNTTVNVTIHSNKLTKTVFFKQGHWQSGGGTLWGEPTSHYDHWTQYGWGHCSTHSRCQSCPISAWSLCHWRRRR